MNGQPLIPEARFRRLLATGLVWPTVLILLFCLALVYQSVVAGTFRDDFMAAQVQDTKGRELRTEVLDMETGLRGYLLTGDRKYLAHYDEVDSRLSDDLNGLAIASTGDSATWKLARHIRTDAMTWRQTALELKDLKSTGRPIGDAKLELSKDQFEDMSREFGAFFAANGLTLHRSEDAWIEQRARVILTLVLGAIAMASILTGIVVLLLRRLSNIYHAALVAYETSVHEIRDLNAELEQRVKERTTDLTRANQELEAFSYSVSHDLRAPLRSVASFSAILQQDLGNKLDDESNDNLNRIRAAAAKMGSLIDALLKFSRIARTALNRTQVDLSQMAQSIFADLSRESPRQVSTSIEPGMVADADPHLIRVVLENLLENAWKFTSTRPNPKIEVGTENGAFYVRDNGVGFEQKYVEKVFLPFERLHTASEFPGTGIGLATTKRVIERHGGKVWAESILDEGTTFHFTLGPDQEGAFAEA